MALQGTIDSFALADVIRLLGASSKTGQLIVNGDRDTTSLWFESGQLVGGETGGPDADLDIVDLVFEVLRAQEGSFAFEPGEYGDDLVHPMDVDAALEAAEQALFEWHDIVRYVPSEDAWLQLAPELPHAEVVIDRACWTSIITVASGITARGLGEALDLNELPTARLVRALVNAGFIEVYESAPSEDAERGPLVAARPLDADGEYEDVHVAVAVVDVDWSTDPGTAVEDEAPSGLAAARAALSEMPPASGAPEPVIPVHWYDDDDDDEIEDQVAADDRSVSYASEAEVDESEVTGPGPSGSAEFGATESGSAGSEGLSWPDLPMRQPLGDPTVVGTDGVAMPHLSIPGLEDDPFATADEELWDRPPSFDQPSAMWETTDETATGFGAADGTDDGLSDVSRSLAHLSPRAAQALASVVGADATPRDGSGTETSAGGADGDEDERARMLRFLGSA